MPKLRRGSSLSREGGGSAEGAGTAADCTERAGESSLELLLESLPLVLLLVLVTESELEERLREPEGQGEAGGQGAWPASL